MVSPFSHSPANEASCLPTSSRGMSTVPRKILSLFQGVRPWRTRMIWVIFIQSFQFAFGGQPLEDGRIKGKREVAKAPFRPALKVLKNSPPHNDRSRNQALHQKFLIIRGQVV